MKLPAPPLPRFLRPAPKRPGTGRDGKPEEPDTKSPGLKEQAQEAGISTLGWLDERSGASPFLRGFLFRKVPKGTNWFYTLG